MLLVLFELFSHCSIHEQARCMETAPFSAHFFLRNREPNPGCSGSIWTGNIQNWHKMPKIDSSVIPANVINNIKLQRALVVEREWMESLLSRGIERSCIAAYLKVLNDYPLVFKHAGRHIIIDNGVVYRYSFDTSESAMDFFSSDVEHHGERTFDDDLCFSTFQTEKRVPRLEWG